jgi:hypothetical protein
MALTALPESSNTATAPMPWRRSGATLSATATEPERDFDSSTPAGKSAGSFTKETFMTKFIRPAVVAAVLFAGASSTMAHSTDHSHNTAHAAHNPTWTDMSKPHGGYDPNSPEGNRAFWDYKARQGGGR